MADIGYLLGKTIKHIEILDNKEAVHITLTNGAVCTMYHMQDCCENVQLYDVVGDIDDLVGSPILQAEEYTNSDDRMGIAEDASFTWTFYKLATFKGYVTLRWLGESNGYYSEAVDFEVKGNLYDNLNKSNIRKM